MYVNIKKSTNKEKKLMAVFFNNEKQQIKTTHFGASGYSDFTKHKDEERKKRYLERHKKNENWNDYTSAGSLSRYILWNKPTLKASIDDYKKRFKLK
jgi:type III secretory pathway component EscR